MDTHSTPGNSPKQNDFYTLLYWSNIVLRFYSSSGALFITWGWIMFLHSLILFLKRMAWISMVQKEILTFLSPGLLIIGVFFSVYSIRKRRAFSTHRTELIKSIRYIWVSLVGCMVAINLIQFNVLHRIDFELQHAIFMVLIAFSIISTGILLRFWFFILGGFLFGIGGYVASYFDVSYQLLVEAMAWLVGFVLPAHLWYWKMRQLSFG